MLEKIPSIVGEALKGLRPGLEKTTSQKEFGDVAETVVVETTAFGHNARMPADFTEDGRKVSPPLAWRNAPSGTAEIVLIIEDADSPTPSPLVHAIVAGLPKEGQLAEGALKGAGGPGAGMVLGQNSFGKAEYLPPDPPSGHGPHRYVIQAFALGKPSGLEREVGRSEAIEALRGKVFAKGVLIGTYERP